MRGSYKVIIQNNRVQFKLTINRNLTIIQGNSATGKTTLLDMVAAHEELGAQSGVTVSCKVPCKTISGKYWRRDLQEISSSIVFIDEGNTFVRSREFAHEAKRSSNYYVIVARESLRQLPYSVDEIYGLKNTNRTEPQRSIPFTLVSTPLHIVFTVILILEARGPSLSLSRTQIRATNSSVCYAKRAALNASAREANQIFATALWTHRKTTSS